MSVINLESIISPDELGRVVQDTWAEQAKKMPNSPDSWKRGWEEISEPMKEIDRKIGCRVALRLMEELVVKGVVKPDAFR